MSLGPSGHSVYPVCSDPFGIVWGQKVDRSYVFGGYLGGYIINSVISY